jgi:molybdopterin synthase catalytic subunit/molybdopterin synthase sulfur carrier subunit
MLREERGLHDERLQIAPGSSAESIYRERCPESAASGLPVAYAINQAYAPPQTILNEGDELVFIPPVGGG